MDQFIKWLIETLLKLFGPPDVDDEKAFREYCRSILKTLEQLAKLTPTQIDDQIVGALRTVVNEDMYWSAFYEIIVQLFGDGVFDSKQLTDDHQERIRSLATKVNVPWMLLVQLIMFILNLIKQGR